MNEFFQVTGRIKNSGINLEASDAGGELDPHGKSIFFQLGPMLISI